MNENKEWYHSRSVWGGIVALGAAMAGLFGLTVEPDAHEALVAALANGAAAIGSLIAIIGRIDARKTIAR